MKYSTKWYPITGHPDSDSCWSLSAGPDGRIYVASCCEIKPGGIVKVVRYNDKNDSVDYLLDVDKTVDDPWNSGRATQCKIHYSFAPSARTNIMYMATHLSGPPYDQHLYSPWRSWHDTERCFRGSALVAFDTKQDHVLWWDTLIPKEGCRCLVIDDERQLLYALSYPRDHLFSFDLKTKKRRDLGRIGSVNAQTILIDRKHRIWTTNDDGYLIRYDPDKDRLEMSPYKLPFDPVYQNGWHNVFYDAVASPDNSCVYAVPWNLSPRMMRLWLNEGEWGRVEDLGPVTQERDLSLPYSTAVDHCGGLVFGQDGNLYFVATRWGVPVSIKEFAERRNIKGIVWRMNPETGEKTEIAVLERPDGCSHYVSRGAIDRNGDLFFGHVLASMAPSPIGFFKLTVPAKRKKIKPSLRVWG